MAERYDWDVHNIAPNSYRLLVKALLSDLSYVQALIDSVDPAESEKLAQSLVNIGLKADIILPMIRASLYCEFSSTKHAETVLRAGSAVTKMMAYYVRKTGQEYLRNVLSATVTAIICDSDLQLEVDTTKLKTWDEESLEAARQRLMNISETFFHKIIDPENLEAMPKEIRTIASQIAQLSGHFWPADTVAHIGGFIMLRFFNPAILAPEAYGIIPTTPAPASRRNLILITKLLQNLANGVEFDGLKEEYMMPLNIFVKEHLPVMQEYLYKVALSESSAPKLTDLEVSRLYGNTTLPSSVSSQYRPRDFDLQDLVVIHRILDKAGAKVLVRLQNLQLERDSTAASLFAKDSEFFQILKDLGPSPPRLSGVTKTPSTPTIAVPSIDSKVDAYMDRSISNILSHKSDIDTTKLEAARVFYAGLPSKANRPVFYFVASRLKSEFLIQPDTLAVHVIKTLDQALNSPFEVVIDMSWSCITSDVRRRAFAHLDLLHKIFSKKHRKNVASVYILLPNAFTRAALAFIKPFTSLKFQQKIIELFEWSSLLKYIESDALRIPAESRNCVTQSYAVFAATSKHRTRERHIKLTTDSLLCIDPKNNVIVKERLITDIRGMDAPPGSGRLIIKFNVTSPVAKSVGFFPSNKSQKGLAETLRLSCASVQERDALIEEIFANRHRFEGAFPQAYRVFKGETRRLERIFKLTADSLMILEGAKIKKETHYAGLERVSLDPVDATAIWVKLKSEETPRKYQCEHAIANVAALKEGMLRFTQENAMEPQISDVEDIYAEAGPGRDRAFSTFTGIMASIQSQST